MANNDFFSEGFKNVRPVGGPLWPDEYTLTLQRVQVWDRDRNGVEYPVPHLIFDFSVEGDVRHCKFVFRMTPKTDPEKFRAKVQSLFHALYMEPEMATVKENRHYLSKSPQEGGPRGRQIRARIAPNWMPVLLNDQYITKEMLTESGQDPDSIDKFHCWFPARDTDYPVLQVFRHNYSLISVL